MAVTRYAPGRRPRPTGPYRDTEKAERARELLALLRQYKNIGHDWSVVEVAGWQARGIAYQYADNTGIAPNVHVDHYTAIASGSGLGVIINGRPPQFGYVPGPLADLFGDRSFKVLHIVASGKSNNAGEGGARGGDSNYDTTAIEQDFYPGITPLPAHALDFAAFAATVNLIRAVEFGVSSIDDPNAVGHKEWAPGRKQDFYPRDYAAYRRRVAEFLRLWFFPPAVVAPASYTRGGMRYVPNTSPQRDYGPYVQIWKGWLNRVNAGNPIVVRLDTNNPHFGPVTDEQTRNFQRWVNDNLYGPRRMTLLDVDGIVGPKTNEAMRYTLGLLGS